MPLVWVSLPAMDIIIMHHQMSSGCHSPGEILPSLVAGDVGAWVLGEGAGAWAGGVLGGGAGLGKQGTWDMLIRPGSPARPGGIVPDVTPEAPDTGR